jgi:hypothetical protein
MFSVRRLYATGPVMFYGWGYHYLQRLQKIFVNLGRVILRCADAGGRPMSNAEFCHAHARAKLSRDRAGGLKVYDDREVRASTDY